MTQILLGPTIEGGTTQKVKNKQDGKFYYRKQILPEGKYKYKDTELDLTADTLKGAVESFKGGAFDEVPFQLGGKESEHNNDPLRRKGTVANVEYVPGKGVYGYFDFSKEPDLAAYVEKYPRFGVSPRLVLDLDRADGKRFPVAIQHVCGTNVPRINGMDPWETVNLAQGDDFDGAEVINLATETVEASSLTPIVTKATGTTDSTKKDNEGGTKVELSQEEYDFLKELRASHQKVQEMFEDDKDETPKTTEVPQEIKLALENNTQEILRIKKEGAANAWKAQKQLLLSQGVPPAALDLADPIMAQPDDQAKVFDLSAGEGEGTVKVSEKTQLLGILESMKGTVDLGGEKGHGIGGTEPDMSKVTQDEIDAWMASQGI